MGDQMDPEAYSDFSGRLGLHLPTLLHQKLSETARQEGVSLNTLMISYLAAGCPVYTDLETEKLIAELTSRVDALQGEVNFAKEERIDMTNRIQDIEDNHI